MIPMIVRTIGLIGFAVAIGYFILMDQSLGPLDSDYVNTTQRILILSGIFVVSSYVLKFLSGVVGVGTTRCKKCGKRIPKSEMFCFDHAREAIWEARERTRTSGKNIKSRA